VKIISHRGYWQSPPEKNRQAAFARSFALGYGTETDVRDAGTRLVISHDMPAGGELSVEQVLALAHAADPAMTLALNIKADGLAAALAETLQRYPGLDAFVFDMAVPDMRAYLRLGIPVLTRMSEVEPQPAWLEQAAGVWLDGFDSVWYDNALIAGLLEQGKRVAIVSNELHGRPHLPQWAQLKALGASSRLLLCTDFPEEATQYFAT
jgi:hypothetical protein